MCKYEVVGDYYRGCGHFHLRYYTGEVTDCGLAVCKTSKQHMHGSSKSCDCPEVVVEDRKVQNLFQNAFAQFSELKAKASKVTNSGVEKFQNVRDRNTSVPMKKTNWDPYSGAPPPPPPAPKVNPTNKPQALASLPPPPSRTGSSIGSGSASPAALSRAPSTASSPPPLPSRGASTGAPPPLPRRSNTLSPPPLPGRSGSTPPTPFSSIAPAPTPPPPPPPSRSPLPPPSRAPLTVQSAPPPQPPPTNFSTKPTTSPVSSFTAPSPALPPRAPPPKRSPAISPKPQPQLVPEVTSEAIQDEIDWADLSEEDKQVFFSWLDEFFTRLLGVPVGPDSAHAGQGHGSSPAGPPPALRLATKPV